MERNLRKKRFVYAIESSDSDDDKERITLDVKKKSRKRKIASSKDDQDESFELCEKVPKKQQRRIDKIKTEAVNDEDETDGKKNERAKNGRTKKVKKEVDQEKNKLKPLRDDTKIDIKKLKNESWTEECSEKVQVELFVNKEKKEEQEIKFKTDFNSMECIDWTNVDYISEVNNVDKRIVENVCKLLNEDNTIPFIARYRKAMTGGMEADQLRALRESFDCAKEIKYKAATIIKGIDKLGKWTPEIHCAIVSSKSLNELNNIQSLFKVASKRSLAERARSLGLGTLSDAALKGRSLSLLSSFVNPQKVGVQTEQEVKESIVHIIADIISKDKVTFEKLRLLRKTMVAEIRTSQSKPLTKLKDESTNTKDKDKYEMYYDFKISERHIKPHQILAINRGESKKVLNVKIVLPDAFDASFKSHCLYHYKTGVQASKLHETLITDAIDYSYKKLIKPLVTRRIRSEMKEKAEAASIEVFATNVKQLLLTSPVRGKIILGIDPGFYHGCKLAVVSEHGNVLDTAVIYPHRNTKIPNDQSAKILINLVTKYKSTVLALGNATACRETEVFLTRLIQSKSFGSMDVSYTIVDESGASIYSCSAEAKSEFPNLDPNLISAISIARRIQDPLAELVKIEPKHLGVGMYQHDLPEKQLMLALNEVVTEAVSFVGVDVNTASNCLLKRVAGLNVSKATNIIQWRNKNGPFLNRQQLLKVKGIGNKSFEQCAGFIRIVPETALVKRDEANLKMSEDPNARLNYLDQTWIHPESYVAAKKLLKDAQCRIEGLGTSPFIEKIKSYAKGNILDLANKLGTDEATLDIIIKGLTMKRDEDIRIKSNRPLFRNSLLSIDDLSQGTVLSGVVRNVTHFGVFVDTGVGRDGLIHTKWLNNQVLSVGQRVEVKVRDIDHIRSRISLQLLQIL